MAGGLGTGLTALYSYVTPIDLLSVFKMGPGCCFFLVSGSPAGLDPLGLRSDLHVAVLLAAPVASTTCYAASWRTLLVEFFTMLAWPCRRPCRRWSEPRGATAPRPTERADSSAG